MIVIYFEQRQHVRLYWEMGLICVGLNIRPLARDRIVLEAQLCERTKPLNLEVCALHSNKLLFINVSYLLTPVSSSIRMCRGYSIVQE